MKLSKIIALVLFVSVSGCIYYFGYLKPADEFRYNILNCMNDTSRVEYDRCFSIMR